jgi:hypothetical protein
MKRRSDENDTGAEGSLDETSEEAKLDSEQSSADKKDGDETKRFERSDNLRRRSEWFQKRTGGR